jgi:hypothetical protein
MQDIQFQVLIVFLVGIISAEIEYIALEYPLKVEYFFIVLFSHQKDVFS